MRHSSFWMVSNRLVLVFFAICISFSQCLYGQNIHPAPGGNQVLPSSQVRQSNQVPINNQIQQGGTKPQEYQVQDPVLGTINLSFINTERQKLKGKKLAPEIINQTLDHYKLSESYLTEMQRIDHQLRMIRAEMADLPNVIGKLKNDLKRATSVASLDLQSMSLTELQQQKTNLESEIGKLRIRSDESTGAAARKRQELQTIRKSIENLEADRQTRIGDRSPQAADPVLVKAWNVEKVLLERLIQKNKDLQRTSKSLFDAELAGQVFVMAGQVVAKELAAKGNNLNQIRTRIESLRKAEANRNKSEVQIVADTKFPELQVYAAKLKALADESVKLAKLLGEIEADRDRSIEDLSNLEKRFKNIKSKVDAVGLTPAIGKLLRKQRLDLQSTSLFPVQSTALSSQVDEAQFNRFQYEEDLNQLPTEEEFLKKIRKESGGTENEDRDRDAKKVWAKQKELLENLVKNYNSYFDALVDLDTNGHKIAKTSSSFRGYIDRRVLWIPSSKPLFRSWSDDGQALWIWDPSKWWLAPGVWWHDLKTTPASWLLLITILGVLGYRNSAYHQRISLSAKKARTRHCLTFRPTWNALFHTLLISTFWPVLFLFLGWRLMVNQGIGNLGGIELVAADYGVIASIGTGLQVVAAVLLPLECLRYLCRKDGLGQAHFSWQPKSSAAMSSLIGTLRIIGLPILFLTCALHHSKPQFGNDLAGRVGFILGMVLLMYALYRTFAPNKGILRSYYARHSGGWLDRLRYVWFSAAFFFPIALVVLAVLGYYYTAWHLSVRVYYVFLLVLFLLFTQELIARLILISGRRSYIEKAKEHRKQASDQQAVLDEELAAAMLVDDDWTEEVKQQTNQSNNLLNGLIALTSVFLFWAIWADVVPALRVVLDQSLWTTTETVSQISEATTGQDAKVVSSEVLRVITPTDLLQAAGIIILTIIVFRNLPGLIDILILNRLPIDQSTQLAITSICSYAVIVVGTVFSAKQLGINWSGVQWLVTALTFGLAFGLQEIFANFVAGIILMFERPIRVGDVVTIGDVTGVVRKTRARATTIRNWDLKELIVPNKEFITGRVLNWTLSDQLSRIVINVGVAYGTDTELVRDQLVEVAKAHPQVLETPAPLATMESFGDSTLDFCLRAYVGKLGDRLRVTSELHQAIEKNFSERQIEIAFPQLDVNLTKSE